MIVAKKLYVARMICENHEDRPIRIWFSDGTQSTMCLLNDTMAEALATRLVVTLSEPSDFKLPWPDVAVTD